jgi:hypothetical protein
MRVRDVEGCEWFAVADTPGSGPDALWRLHAHHVDARRRKCAPARPGLEIEFTTRDISEALLKLVAERIAGVL